jgi:hypothetical protein
VLAIAEFVECLDERLLRSRRRHHLASLPTRSRPAQKSHQPTIIESRYEVKRGGRSAPARGSGVAFVDNIDAKTSATRPLRYPPPALR